MQSKNIEIYDTSLRDGMQGMQINYTLENKLKIAQKLDEFQVDYIEGGFPLSSEKENEFFIQVKKLHLQHAKIAAFGSTAKPSTNISSDIKYDNHINALLNAETEIVTIVAKSSIAHVNDVIRASKEAYLEATFESVRILKENGRTVILDLEHFFDGSKLDSEYSIEVLKVGTEAGADLLVLCDTNGGTLPHEVQYIMSNLPKQTIAPLGGHFHDDCGVATANSLVCLEEGAIHIQGTINGWGERSGNANLCTIIPNLVLKDTRYTAHCASEITHLTSLSRFVAEQANIISNPRDPFVGRASFSHKAGQHADVILKNKELMEHISPKKVGNERRILLSELAGKSTIVAYLQKHGEFSKKDPIVQGIIQELKQREQDGYEYETAEASFELIILRALGKMKSIIQLKNYHIEQFKSFTNPAQTVCRIFVQYKGKELMGAATGNGPVEALDTALRHSLGHDLPTINNIKLIDYRVRVIDPENNTSAKVRVFISFSDGTHSWETIGVNENIIEASWGAIMDGVEYYFNALQNTIQ